MAREVHKFTIEASVIKNGVWKSPFNFDGTVLQIICQPTSSDTIYNFGIKDENEMVSFLKTDVQGLLISSELDLVIFPGEKQLVIENSSKDESFRIKIIYQL